MFVIILHIEINFCFKPMFTLFKRLANSNTWVFQKWLQLFRLCLSKMQNTKLAKHLVTAVLDCLQEGGRGVRKLKVYGWYIKNTFHVIIYFKFNFVLNHLLLWQQMTKDTSSWRDHLGIDNLITTRESRNGKSLGKTRLYLIRSRCLFESIKH